MFKLISLNIERRRHWNRILPFFSREQPDVLCLQEVVAEDVPKIAQTLQMPTYRFVVDGIVLVEAHGDPTIRFPAKTGIAILSRYPFIEEGSAYYYLPPGGVRLETDTEPKALTNAQALLWATFKDLQEEYTIAVTHFTWTPNGHSDQKQERDFAALAPLLSALPPHVLVGDLNAPRGRGMWERFAELYDEDHIPLHVVSTIDPLLHRKKGLSLVVDGLFSHRAYNVKNVHVISDVSDHCAISATIRRKQRTQHQHNYRRERFSAKKFS